MTLKADIYERIVGAKIHIDRHYMDDIDLKSIAREACFSKFHFHRLFTAIYKVTPHQYLTDKRLQAATLLLEKEGISIKDISILIGFQSVASFSLLYKKQHGFTPGYYRNIAWVKKKLALEQPKKFIPHCYVDQYNMGK